MRKILLSIHPEHVENILNGTKLFEYRKTRCRETVEAMVIYATAPKKRIVAEATIDDVIVGSVHKVWRLTGSYAGITYRAYRDYFKGKNFAVAYQLGTVREFNEPRTLSDFGIARAPQSFTYLP